ncbi:hypothetical protein ACWESM_18715 [Nocardia sp. NPDC003999]
MTTLAVADTVDATLVPITPDPFDALMRYAEMLARAQEFAEYICVTPMVPTIYQGKPKHATVAILHGAELGLNPLQSLQQIFTVHGMPAIYARTMVALLKSKGFRFKTVESGPTRAVITGTSRDGVETETSTWTIERADEAGYIPKIDPATGVYAVNKYGKLIGNEKYITEPENMLWAKAAAEVCRRLAPDVLLGISRTVEDIESEPEPVRVQSERLSAAEVTTGPAEVKQWTPPPAETATPAESGEPAPPVPVEDAPPTDPPMNRVQQKKVGRLFGERGITEDAAILSAVGAFLGRDLAAPAEVTRGEAIRLLAHLEADPPANDTQLKRLGELLDEAGLGADIPDRWEFLSIKTNRPIAKLEHLTTAECTTLIELIEASLNGPADDEPAGDAQ